MFTWSVRQRVAAGVFVAAGLLFGLLGCGQPPTKPVAIVGEEADVVAAVAPLVANGSLELQRVYPNPTAYMAEAPSDTFQLTATNVLTLQLYLANDQALQSLPNPQQVSNNSTVDIATGDMPWLSYLPGQFLVSGDCGFVDANGLDELDGIIMREMELLAPDVAWLRDERDETIWRIRRYETSDTPLRDALPRLSSLDGCEDIAIRIEPNHLFMGGQGYIAGSPGGPIVSNAPTPTPLPAPPVDPEVLPAGQGVHVIIFDTVPITDTVIVTGPVSLTTADGSAAISYDARYSLPDLLPRHHPEFKVRGHGTFVAHPVLRYAPAAKVRLVRVMNQFGYGDLFTWYQALTDFTADPVLQDRNVMKGAVFNYSFVVILPDESSIPIVTSVPLTTTTILETVVLDLETLQIVQVAAAGNDAAPGGLPLATPPADRWPATDDHVLGVSAVTRSGDRACYSNLGKVAAPGGGISAAAGLCKTAVIVTQCAAPSAAAASNCITGWDPTKEAGDSDVSWGLGTSFAAPHVTAMVTQYIAANAMPGHWLYPVEVRSYIENQVGVSSGPWAGLLFPSTP
ncbi:MAG: S8/S53 family peptidase [Chloroflexota bacterium]